MRGQPWGGVEEGRLSGEAGSRLTPPSNFRFLKSNHPHPLPSSGGLWPSIFCDVQASILGHTWVFTPVLNPTRQAEFPL